MGRTARAGAQGRSCTIAAEADRKVVKQAVKSSRAQGARVVSRVVDNAEVDDWDQKLKDLDEEIEEILKEEKEEKLVASADMQIRKGENLIRHEDEIMARPKRTWFESEQDKRTAKKAGRVQLNGPDVGKGGDKKKLSGKDKKRLDVRRERMEGKGGWKKGKNDAEDIVKAAKGGGGHKEKKPARGMSSRGGGKMRGKVNGRGGGRGRR